MNKLEIEVKYFISDIIAVKKAILGLGAEDMGLEFETNIRFENEKKNLFDNKSLLRLRKAKKTTLTFKSAPPEKANTDQYKIHTELEVEVNDFDVMHLILNSIGFHKEQVYEKYRETLILKQGDAHTCFCIDTLPFGNFLEIESQGEDIKQLAAKIGFKWEDRILLTYLEIFEIIKRKEGLPFTDITFQNFHNKPIDLSDLFRFFRAEN